MNQKTPELIEQITDEYRRIHGDKCANAFIIGQKMKGWHPVYLPEVGIATGQWRPSLSYVAWRYDDFVHCLESLRQRTPDDNISKAQRKWLRETT